MNLWIDAPMRRGRLLILHTYFDCFPCFIDQALRAGRMATDDEQKIKRLLDEIAMLLKDIRLESTAIQFC